MQSSKCWLTICAAAVSFSVWGGDTPEQIKAREALEKQLYGSPGQVQPSAPAAVVPAAPATPPKAPAPVTQPAADPEAIAKARAAMEQKLRDMQGQPPQVAPAPAPVVAQPPPPKPRAQPKVKAPPPVAPAPAPAPVVQAPAAPALIQAPAADPAAIEKARQAVRQQTQAPQPPPVAVPAPQPPVVSAPAPAPTAPAPAAPAPVVPPAVTAAEPSAAPTFAPVPAGDPQAIEKAQQALRAKMVTLEAEAPTPSAAPPPPPNVPSSTPAAVQAPTTPGINAPQEADPAAIAKAREAVRLTLETNPQVAASASTPAAQATANKYGLNFPPLQGPALPISPEKQQRLQSLLQSYRMDLISPEQYQATRAKILAEP